MSASPAGGRRLVSCLAVLWLAAAVVWPQAPGPSPEAGGDEAAELVNSLLSGLLGFGEATEASLQAEVAETGGVPFKTPVPVEYMGRKDLKRYVAEMFEAEYPPADAEADARTLRAFDLLPVGTDLRKVRAQALEQNVVGFYDERPDRRRLYVVSEEKALTPMNQLVLSHELRHALQDQHMGIHELLGDDVSDYDDRSLALLSLLEGDATFVMERFLLKRLPSVGSGLDALGGDGAGVFGMGAMPAAAVPGAPPIVRDQLVLPYFAGRDFVKALFDRGGWAAIRSAWARPPASSEQVLHPAKYAALEAPRAVAPWPAPGGARLLRAGVLGEALLRTWLGEGGETAAAGWGGDAFQSYDVGDGKTLLTWKAVWDTPEDAREFLAAARRRVAAGGAPAGRSRADGFELSTLGSWTFATRLEAGAFEMVSSDSRSLVEMVIGAATRPRP